MILNGLKIEYLELKEKMKINEIEMSNLVLKNNKDFYFKDEYLSLKLEFLKKKNNWRIKRRIEKKYGINRAKKWNGIKYQKKRKLEKGNNEEEDNKVTKGYLLSSIITSSWKRNKNYKKISDYLDHQNMHELNPKTIKYLIKNKKNQIVLNYRHIFSPLILFFLLIE